MAGVTIYIESTPVWWGTTDDPGKLVIPVAVVDRIRSQATWALEHGARVPKVEVAIKAAE